MYPSMRMFLSRVTLSIVNEEEKRAATSPSADSSCVYSWLLLP